MSRDEFVETLTADQLHGEDQTVGEFVQLVSLANERTVEVLEEVEFVLDLVDVLRGEEFCSSEDLEGDRPAGLLVDGLVDLGLAALSDFAEDAVTAAKLASGGQFFHLGWNGAVFPSRVERSHSSRV